MRARLDRLLSQRILVLDGAMGSLIQGYKLGEADFRGERFRDHPTDVKGDSDLWDPLESTCRHASLSIL